VSAWVEARAGVALISEPSTRRTWRRQHGKFPKRSTYRLDVKSKPTLICLGARKRIESSHPIGMVRLASQLALSVSGTQRQAQDMKRQGGLSEPPRKSCDHIISRRRDKQSLLGTATKPLAPRLMRQEIRDTPLPPHSIPRNSSSTNRNAPQQLSPAQLAPVALHHALLFATTA
jgi:hypothetical protein